MTRNEHEQKLEQDLEHTKPYTHLKRMIASHQNASGEAQRATDPKSSGSADDHVQDPRSSGMAAAIRGVQAASSIKAITRHTETSESQGQLSEQLSQNIRAIRAVVQGEESSLPKKSSNDSASGPASIGDPQPTGDPASTGDAVSTANSSSLSMDVSVQDVPASGDDLAMRDSDVMNGQTMNVNQLANQMADALDRDVEAHLDSKMPAGVSGENKTNEMDFATKNYPGLSSRVEEGNQNITDVAKGAPKSAPKNIQGKKSQQNAKNEKGGQGSQGGGKKRKRRLPIWLLIILNIIRILFVPALCVFALYAGLRIGYVHFGEQNPDDIWDVQTWKHLFDLIFADS